MSQSLFIFPADLTKPCTLAHDIAGWTITSHPGSHPSNGALAQVFDLPDGTPNGNGATLTIPGVKQPYHGVLYLDLPTGAGMVMDVFPPGATTGNAAPFGPVSIDGDHFVSNGRRWIWRMTTGFCDYKVFLDGGDLRSLLAQNQDLGARGRRNFLMMRNITDFNPDSYGQSFYDRLPEFLALYAEYEQYAELDVFPDANLLGWPLGKCQAHWARVNDAVRPSWNRFVSLTNEFDHGGNLVGIPDDYARPGGLIASQGSAVQDATPPCPMTGKGSGYDYWEWHAADPPTKFSHEYFIWQGLSTGAIKPTVISEHGRRITEQNADEDYMRSLAHASMANGCGLTVHTEDGKYSRLLGPRQASCVNTAMTILANAS